MKELYLLSYGELSLKGKNRPLFIKRLISNIKAQLKKNPAESKIKNTYGRIFLETELPEKTIENILSKIFGLTGFGICHAFPLDYAMLEKGVIEIINNEMKKYPLIKTFRVSARRSNKNFPKNSDSINRELGASVLSHFPQLNVKMKEMDLNVQVEIREQEAYVYFTLNRGLGGLPVGCSGKGLLLLSGGIDSPVAGWSMLKRGMAVTSIHFFSPPYTSQRARQKVIDLAKKLTEWGGDQRLFIVNFTSLQLLINKTLKTSMTTVLIRKAMLKIAEKICQKNKFQTIITGESLGQVASQTIESISCTSHQISYPILRPLIGSDKVEITGTAKKIDTFETSVLPYEDCCTLFLPEHPVTKPNVREVENEFNDLDLSTLIQEAVENAEIVDLNA